MQIFKYDVFISYAHEDRSLALELKRQLQHADVEAWISAERLKIGASIVKEVNDAITNARFSAVLLTRTYWDKSWAMSELESLYMIQQTKNTKKILPIWHELSHLDIQEKMPLIADLVAVNTAIGLDEVAKRIAELVHAEK